MQMVLLPQRNWPGLQKVEGVVAERKKESGFQPIIKTVCDSCFLTACESTAVCHHSFTAPVSPHVRESRTVLDSGLHVVDSGLQLLDSNICQ